MRKPIRFQLRDLIHAAAVSLIFGAPLVSVPGQDANAETPKLEILKGHGGGVATVAVSPDGRLGLTGRQYPSCDSARNHRNKE